MLIKLFGAASLTGVLGPHLIVNAAVFNPVYGPAILDEEDQLAQVGNYLMVPDQYFNIAQSPLSFANELAEVDANQDQEGLPAPVELGQSVAERRRRGGARRSRGRGRSRRGRVRKRGRGRKRRGRRSPARRAKRKKRGLKRRKRGRVKRGRRRARRAKRRGRKAIRRKKKKSGGFFGSMFNSAKNFVV